uniref:Putative transcriptional regulator n=1 Tax=Alternaria solani TaxID=48100 RepID=A0A455XIN6_ALTSO|nr:putative transcriptional regulator [Alternaria solani]
MRDQFTLNATCVVLSVSLVMPERLPDGRSRRPATSCLLCRKRKTRCNQESPCSNCIRSRNENCVYDSRSHPAPISRARLSQAQAAPVPRHQESVSLSRTSNASGSTLSGRAPISMETSSTAPSTPPSQASALDSESLRLKLRIQDLEEQLSRLASRPVNSPFETPNSTIQMMDSTISGTFHVHCEGSTLGQQPAIARSVSHKTRFFGQSHWAVNGVLLIRDVFESIDAHSRPETTKAWTGIERCKSLARFIKSHRTDSWLSSSTPNLPPKEVSDTLVDCYLRSTESIYRILHIPSFRRNYEAVWISNMAAADRPFMIQLSLVLAIGALTYDERFSLRTSATQWVCAARSWLLEPKSKSHLDIQTLQTSLLFLIAQERLGVADDSTWISVGSLLRKAIYMGLHRDPAFLPPRTTFAAEMRRRLWNTILEMTLQSSLTSGGPPFISLNDFDTAPPGNFDDDQIMTDDPVPQPPDSFTQVSMAIAIRETFPQRLEVVRFLNDLASPVAYDRTLQLDAKLRAAYKSLRSNLLAFNQRSGATSASSPYEIRMADFIMHRYLLSLHAPYFGASLSETVYAFSRKVVVESSLKIWRAAYPVNLNNSVLASDANELPRLITCSSGFYPAGAIHAAFLVAIDLRMQLKEDESLEPVPLRPDLLSVIHESKQWCLQVIEAGETSVKGYLLMNVIVTQIEGLMHGLSEEEIVSRLIKAVEDVEEKCMPMLKVMASEFDIPSNDSSDEPQLMDLIKDTETVDDFGCMPSDTLFDFASTEPIGWTFNDNPSLGTPALW